jgi:carotenoid cleavage dioxygenase-like enzyme
MCSSVWRQLSYGTPSSTEPLTMQALASGKLGDYVIIKWKPEEESLLHVVPLDGKGPVRSFKAPRYFTFHYMNAYESGKCALMAAR